MEKLLNSLLGINNTNVSLKFNVYDKTIPYSAQTQEEQFEDKKLKMVVQFDGSFSIMDLENIKICGTLTAKLNDTNIVIDIAFIDKK